MMEFYTGVGSRQIPSEVESLMIMIGEYFSSKYTLRSGGADGADYAFEWGCRKGNGAKEIYLPWRNFNYNESPLYPDNLKNWYKAMEIASETHPAWEKLSQGAARMHTRNVFQVLGKTLDNPSKFVVCYAPVEFGLPQGGTAQAIRIAENWNIPVYNLFDNNVFKSFIKKVKST